MSMHTLAEVNKTMHTKIILFTCLLLWVVIFDKVDKQLNLLMFIITNVELCIHTYIVIMCILIILHHKSSY